MQKGHVLRVIFVECQVFYVWNLKKRGMGECVIEKSSLASQPYFSAYFSAYAHARAKVGGGREGKIRLGRGGRPARFL